MSKSARILLVLVTLATAGGTGHVSAATPSEAPEPQASSAWLGVFVGDAIDGGVQLVAVVAGGPAEKAGLRAGDLLLRLDGEPVPDRDAINVLTRRIEPGKRVAAEIVREGRRQTRWLETVSRSGPAWSQLVTTGGDTGDLGTALAATVVAIPETLRLHYGAPADRGALVAGVSDGGVGAAAGLHVGDVIVAVDGAPVRDPNVFRSASGSSLKRVELVRAGARKELQLPAAAAAPAPPLARSDDARVLRAEVERLRVRVQELEHELDVERGRPRK